MRVETASAHDRGDCSVDCSHPECTWAGVVDLTQYDVVAFDDLELACRQLEPVLL